MSLTAATTRTEKSAPYISPSWELFSRDLLNLHLHHSQTDNISGRAERYNYDIWIPSAKSIAFCVRNSRLDQSFKPSCRPNLSRSVKSGAGGGELAKVPTETVAGPGTLNFTTRDAEYTCIRPGKLWRVTWQAGRMGRFCSMVVDVVTREVLAFIRL